MLHLGLAIRAQPEHENLVEATKRLQAHVDAGALLGRLEEIRQFRERIGAQAGTSRPSCDQRTWNEPSRSVRR